MNTLITLCARGGSKGIPGKNVKLLNGKPVLHYSLTHATKLSKIYDVDIQLSTDDPAIVKSAEEFGYYTDYIRPDYLATDEMGKIDVIRDAWKVAEQKNEKEYDFIIDLDVSSPLRSVSDIEKALLILKENETALNIFSVNEAARNPYFNMVEKKTDGFVKLVGETSLVKTRQSAPKVYDMNASFYIFRREYMLGSYQSSITNRSIIFIMDHICFDLDEPIDFVIMEFLMKKKYLDFSK